MTDDEPNSVSMEDAMQAIRDALGYRDSLTTARVNSEPAERR